MTLEELNRKFARMTVEMRKAVDSDLPKIAGNEAVRLFKQNFREEGFFGKKWEKKRMGKGKTLTKSGDLGRSIQYNTEPGRVTVESDLPYSKIHNEGGTIEVTEQMKKYFWAMHYKTKDDGFKAMALKKVGEKIVVPQRRFIGNHPELRKAIKEKVRRRMNDIIK